MKKFLAALILCTSILLTGCKSFGSGKSNMVAEPFFYPKYESDIWAIAADSDTLYVLASAEDGRTSEIGVFDVDGNQIKKALLKGHDAYDVKCICAEDGIVYAAINENGLFIICSADMERGEVKTIFELENTSVKKLGVYDGKLYWLGESFYDAEYVDPIFTDDGVIISYNGTGMKIGCLDIANGENIMSDFELPASFAVSGSGVTVYAFDREKGYYFADYSYPNEKVYTNKLNIINDFDFFGEDGAFVFEFHGVLNVSKADDKTGVAQAVNNVSILSTGLCASESGFVWVTVPDAVTNHLRQVKRYDLSDFSVNGDPVRIISSQYYSNNIFSAGVEVSTEQLSEEGFALKVLSLDKNYDIARVSSDQSVSNDIKEKGSFYPLNDVKGVAEYLDKCFPYIKEAVTDDEGNICMLPISVEIPIIAYNEKNCAENGIVFSSDLEEFISSIERASAVNDYYTLLRYNMINLQLMGYTSCNVSFDTDEFRSMAALLKERCTDDVFKLNMHLNSAIIDAQMGDSEIYDQILFTQLLYRDQQVGFIGDKNFRAATVPCPKSGKNIAVCTFLCVNPYSDRLSETLTYIENVTESLSSLKNYCMFSDKSTYDDTVFARDMYSIYENGYIYFQIPGDIYRRDFNRYCADEITLEELISEADRKLAVYLNE